MFAVRIRRELWDIEGATPEWRGHITHVPSGERCYIRDLDEIPAFIASYLKGVGGKFQKWRRRQPWLRRLKMYLSRKLWDGGRGTG